MHETPDQRAGAGGSHPQRPNPLRPRGKLVERGSVENRTGAECIPRITGPEHGAERIGHEPEHLPEDGWRQNGHQETRPKCRRQAGSIGCRGCRRRQGCRRGWRRWRRLAASKAHGEAPLRAVRPPCQPGVANVLTALNNFEPNRQGRRVAPVTPSVVARYCSRRNFCVNKKGPHRCQLCRGSILRLPAC